VKFCKHDNIYSNDNLAGLALINTD